MRLLRETKEMIVFVSFFSIALVILVGVPIRKSFAMSNVNLSFDSAVFTHPLTIDNPYMPLVVGTTYLYRSETEDGTEEDTVIVTNQKNKLGGVKCRAVSDVVTLTNEVLDHEPTEVTTDWYAQDDDGNVWYCGEDTVEYIFDDDFNKIGESTESSWNADEPGAEPGIAMLANPMIGDSYRQEFLEDVAEDMAKVLRLDATVSIEFGDFDNCLETKEWTPLEQGSIEHKYYYPSVGLVYNTVLSGGKTVKVELVDITP